MSVVVSCWKDKMFAKGDFKTIRKLAVELPGFKKIVNDSLMFEASGKNIEHMLSVQGIHWKDMANEVADQYRRKLKKEQELIENKKKFSLDSATTSNYKFKTKPFDHQLKAWSLSKDLEYYGYFMEMGTGKTKVLIDNAAYLFMKGEIDSVVVLAPNGVHSQWINEQLPDHMPEEVEFISAFYKASDVKKLKEMDKISKEKTNKLKFIAFNIDALSSEKGVRYINKFLLNHKAMLVIDESVRIKTPSSNRTKSAIKIAANAKYRRIMSGAPVTKGYEDLYAQLRFLHPDILGFTSFYTFRNHFCQMGGFESRQITGYKPDAVKELEAKLETFTFRTTKQECLDLPEKIYTVRQIELTSKQRELYTKIQKEMIVDLESVSSHFGKEMNSALMSAITKMLRLQQIVCGNFVYEEELENGEKIKHEIDIENNRISALLECVQEAQGKVIVWSRFVSDIHKISKILESEKIKFVKYYGDVKTEDREKNINIFRNDPECKVFLAQPASGGTGLNLAVADTMIYYSNDFNADTRWQSEDRAHRIGQKNNVTYIDFVSPKTIDENILEALRNKKNVADALLDDPRRMIKYD